MSKLVIIIFAFFLFSCKQKNYQERIENDGDPVVSIESDDAEMNTAILKTKETYSEFIKAFKSQEENTRDYFVKMKFEDSLMSEVEHMWLGDLFFQRQIFFGVLSSDPVYIKAYEMGDTIQIQGEMVSDWSYVKNNKLIGGHTIKVLYNRMNEKEKAEFKEMVDYTIE